MAASVENARLRKLDAVFNKAVNVASNSLTENDLIECFGDLTDQYGSTIQKLFINMIAKTQSNIEVSKILADLLLSDFTAKYSP
jgi:hypothetical protein